MKIGLGIDERKFPENHLDSDEDYKFYIYYWIISDDARFKNNVSG